MLEKVSIKEPSNSQIFLCNRENLVKCNACVISQNIAIESRIAFSEIRLFFENHSLDFHAILHENTLGKKELEC